MAPSRVTRGLAVLLLVGSLAACASGTSPDAGRVRAEGVEARTVALTDATALDDVVDAAWRFGAGTLALAEREGNVVLSPASLATAFAMLAEGAGGESLAELDAVLGAGGDQRRDAFAAVRSSLAPLDGDPADATADELPERPLVHLADQVVLDDEFEARDEFLAALASTFDAGVQRADLGSEAGMDVLSDWVRHHSGGLIEETAIQPEPTLRLVLQDAVLLAARWQAPFPESGTSDSPFTLPDGSLAEVETMHTDNVFASAEVDGWAAVRLPYTEGLHADVLLPPEGRDPAEVTPELLARIGQALDAADPMKVVIALPVVDTGTVKTDLLPMLPNLGLGALACGSEGVDLSGIAGEPGGLCVAQVAQQAVLKVHEAGTVAAAVTEIAVGESAAMGELRFDRPFLFSVSHDVTGWPLFLAAIRDPRQ